MTAQHKLRSAKDGPFCWQSKAARRAIRDAFDASNNVTTALAVYDALSEVASDERSETFTTAHAWIARLSGVSVRTIQSHLRVFETLGLIHVEVPALRAPGTYRLLPFGSQSTASGSECLSFGNQCLAFGNGSKQARLPRYEESGRIKKKVKEVAGPALPVPARDSLFDALANAEGSSPGELTKPGAKKIAVALAQIRKASPDVTAAEIQQRARIYRSVMPGGTRITANALAVHWAKCGPARTENKSEKSIGPTPPADWRERIEAAYPGNLTNANDRPFSDLPLNIVREVFPELVEAESA